MKKILLLISFVFLTLISCSKDDASTRSDEEYLQGTWTIKKTMTYQYLNGELDTTKEVILEEPYSTLHFARNNEVTYSNPDFSNPVTGVWSLNERILTTDLRIDLSSSTGYGSIYIFPENTISLINDTELILKSPMSLEVTVYPDGNKLKSYSETFLEK